MTLFNHVQKVPLLSNRRRAGRWAAAVLCSVVLCLWLGAATTARAGDVLMTMPFENVSGRAEYHWVGESFAVLLSDLLDTPGLVVIRPDERNLAFERVGVRVTDLLTRAAEIRVAE